MQANRANANQRSIESEPDPAMLKAQVEAVLFISREPLPIKKISQLAGNPDSRKTRRYIKELNERYRVSQRSFQIKRLAGGYQMLTRPQFSSWLRRLEHVLRPKRLSTPAMETLAVVAYRQPIMKAEIELIRGVSCGEMLKQLVERGLVRISGRSEELGRPYLYSTTKNFLAEFGLPSLDALPRNDQLRGEGIPENSIVLSGHLMTGENQQQLSLSHPGPSEESTVKMDMSTMVLDQEDENQLTGVAAVDQATQDESSNVRMEDDDEFEEDLDDDDDFDDEEYDLDDGDDDDTDDFEDDEEGEFEDDEDYEEDEDWDDEGDDEDDDGDEWEEVEDDEEEDWDDGDEEDWDDDEDEGDEVDENDDEDDEWD